MNEELYNKSKPVEINTISNKSEEGRLLIAALSVITTLPPFTTKTPMEVLGYVHELKKYIYSKPHVIPDMTDPLGKYWEQPSKDAIAVDDKHAVMDQATFIKLKDYTHSRPTGTYPGKMWRAIYNTKEGVQNLLYWFGEVHGDEIDVCNREVLFLD